MFPKLDMKKYHPAGEIPIEALHPEGVCLRDVLSTYDILILVLRTLHPWQLCEFAQVCRWYSCRFKRRELFF